ncbi:hypothetical protein [Corynebacterium accolens]|uniref:hypothetical protein n=1 Tax=Corynebacterium TaxID=1716 RepID=UPI00254C65F3|nr:hypothetical protein [Corynebacterium accolens]MDK8471799.1 hypothetical protein [Corynebacterium accolens]MDK8618060.1 hypothetical protein [Corynebacterium accolens]
MKLLWHTTEWVGFGVLLFLSLYPAIFGGKWGAIIALIPILTYQPDFYKYQILGLNSEIWNKHRRILVTVFAVVAVVGGAARQYWWVLPIYAAALCWALWRKQTPTRTGYSTTPLGITSRIGRYPPTLEAQAVYRRQIRIWLIAVGLVIVAVAVSLLSTLWEPLEAVAFIVWILLALFAMQPMGVLRETLKDYVTLGGTRGRWAVMTAATGVIPIIGCAAVGLALSSAASGVWPMFSLATVAALSVPGFTYLEFLEKKTLGAFVVYGLAVAGLVWLLIQEKVTPLQGMIIAIVLYTLWALTLPMYARRISSMWDKGIKGWFGVK